MFVEKVDSEKSKLMYKKREEYDAIQEKFEEEQEQFINEIIKKYNIKTRKDILQYMYLFPESYAKFKVLDSFPHLDSAQNLILTGEDIL